MVVVLRHHRLHHLQVVHLLQVENRLLVDSRLLVVLHLLVDNRLLVDLHLHFLVDILLLADPCLGTLVPNVMSGIQVSFPSQSNFLDLDLVADYHRLDPSGPLVLVLVLV